MHFINYIRVPFTEAVNTFSFSDAFLYSVLLTGYYQQLPLLFESFDNYSTGGGELTQLYFSGSGGFNGSGYSFNPKVYFYDFYNNYNSGEIYLFDLGVGISGYSQSIITGYTSLYNPNPDLPFSLSGTYMIDIFESYLSGYISGLTGAINSNDNLIYSVTGNITSGAFK